jgi:hypothetical protein
MQNNINNLYKMPMQLANLGMSPNRSASTRKTKRSMSGSKNRSSRNSKNRSSSKRSTRNKKHKGGAREGDYCNPSVPNSCGTWANSGNLYCDSNTNRCVGGGA